MIACENPARFYSDQIWVAAGTVVLHLVDYFFVLEQEPLQAVV